MNDKLPPFPLKPVLGFVGAAILIGAVVYLSSSPSQTQLPQGTPVAQTPETPAAPAPAEAPAPEPQVPEKPTELAALGVKKPDQREIHWTAYYITPAKMANPGKGRTVTYTNLKGETKKLQVTKECYDQAEVEAAAVGVDKNGVEHFAYRVAPGVWKELPHGCAGMGNKVNALVPIIHVAADQRKFPFGSMVYAPVGVGMKLGDSEVSDGYFWVSDVGGAVEGNHFDLFVGKESVYKDFLGRDKKPTYPTTIYKLPAPPKGLDPRTDEGLTAILKNEGLIKEDTTSIEKYKILEALIQFQQANPHIPVPEYGNPRAATTLWFLTQSAIKASSPPAEATAAK